MSYKSPPKNKNDDFIVFCISMSPKYVREIQSVIFIQYFNPRHMNINIFQEILISHIMGLFHTQLQTF